MLRIGQLKKFFIKEILRRQGVKVFGMVDVVGLNPLIQCSGEIILGDGVLLMCRQGPRINLTSHRGAILRLGRSVFLNQSATIIATIGIEIGDYTKIGPHVVIHDYAYHEVNEGDGPTQAPIQVGRNVWIGRGSIVMPGLTIGDHSVIGTGSVVTKSVPPKTVVAGNPARVVRDIKCHDDYIRP